MNACISSLALAVQLSTAGPSDVDPGLTALTRCADIGVSERADGLVLSGGVRLRPIRIDGDRPLWIRFGLEGDWRTRRRVIGGCVATPGVKCPPKSIVEPIDPETGELKRRFHIRPVVGAGLDLKLGRDAFLSPHVDFTDGGRLTVTLGIKL